ncbi:MAG TPA: response regulator [Gemmatimonadales bacterium]|jgi:CheY-like chemotaxis protein|nr:response regulator [Gemmatimonadales bacterium]
MQGLALTVLVVDDEPVVRRLAYRILNSAGYRVLESSDGAEALDVLRASPTAIDLVIVDAIMPNVDGATLSTEIFDTRPTQRVLLMSAHGEEVFSRLGLRRRMNAPFLAKPFTDAELLAKVERALTEPLLVPAQTDS